jgi:hypothetical protein
VIEAIKSMKQKNSSGRHVGFYGGVVPGSNVGVGTGFDETLPGLIKCGVVGSFYVSGVPGGS